MKSSNCLSSEIGTIIYINSLRLCVRPSDDNSAAILWQNWPLHFLWQNRPLIWVASPDVTDSREKRNQGQFVFLRQKIW
jgi:hypothetical protein